MSELQPTEVFVRLTKGAVRYINDLLKLNVIKQYRILAYSCYGVYYFSSI